MASFRQHPWVLWEPDGAGSAPIRPQGPSHPATWKPIHPDLKKKQCFGRATLTPALPGPSQQRKLIRAFLLRFYSHGSTSHRWGLPCKCDFIAGCPSCLSGLISKASTSSRGAAAGAWPGTPRRDAAGRSGALLHAEPGPELAASWTTELGGTKNQRLTAS